MEDSRQFAELIHPPLDTLVQNSPLADRAIAYGNDDGDDDDIDDDEYKYKDYDDEDDVISNELEGTVIPGPAYDIITAAGRRNAIGHRFPASSLSDMNPTYERWIRKAMLDD